MKPQRTTKKLTVMRSVCSMSGSTAKTRVSFMKSDVVGEQLSAEPPWLGLVVAHGVSLAIVPPQ